MQREAEMRAAIVDGGDAAIMSIHRNGAILTTHNHDTFSLDFRDGADTHHRTAQVVHERLPSLSTNGATCPANFVLQSSARPHQGSAFFAGYLAKGRSFRGRT